MQSSAVLLIGAVLVALAAVRTSAASPQELADRVLRSYRPDPNLAEAIVDLGAALATNPDLLPDVDDAQLCLLYDRIQALRHDVALTDAILNSCDYLPNAIQRFQQLKRCRWDGAGRKVPSSYTWVVRPADSDLFADLQIPMPERSHQPMTEDALIAHLIAHLGADALKDADVLLQLISARARLHLVNVLYHVPMSATELDPILPLFTSFWSVTSPLDWGFLDGLRRLGFADSATSLDSFWQIGAVRDHFHDRAPDLIDGVALYRLERLQLLDDVRYPYAAEVFDDVPLLYENVVRFQNFDLLERLLAQPGVQLDLGPFVDSLGWSDIVVHKGQFDGLLRTLLQHAPESIWRQTAFAVLDRNLSAVVTPDYVEGVLRDAVPLLDPVGPVGPYEGQLDVARLMQAHFGVGWRVERLVVLAGRQEPQYLSEVVNTPNAADGNTLLHYAVRNYSPDLLHVLLVVRGIDLGARNHDGHLAFDYFREAWAGGLSGIQAIEALVRQIESIRQFFQ